MKVECRGIRYCPIETYAQCAVRKEAEALSPQSALETINFCCPLVMKLRSKINSTAFEAQAENYYLN